MNNQLMDIAQRTIPLTYQQQRAWRLAGLSDRINYGIPVPLIIRIKGRLDINTLTQSIDQLIKRHDALRTRINLIDEIPMQTIAPHIDFTLSVTDLSAHADKESEAQQFIRDMAWHASDIYGKPLFRVSLLKMAEEDHILILAADHLIADGYSLKIIMRDICSFYNQGGLASQQPIGQYSDYSSWQAEWLSSDEAKSHQHYWDKCMEAPPLTPLPSYAIENDAMLPIVMFPLSADVTDSLASVAANEGATLYIALMAAYIMLLARWSGEREITVSSLVVGRDKAQFKEAVGFFASTIISKTEVADNIDFKKLLRTVRNSLIEANKHHLLPAETLKPFAVSRINFINQDTSTWDLRGLEATTLDSPLDPRFSFDRNALTQFQKEHPIELHLMLGNDGLRCTLYSGDWSFQYTQLERFSNEFQSLLQQIINNPIDTPLKLASNL